MMTDSMAFFDPRLLALGARVICPHESLEVEEKAINLKLNEEDYEIIRTLYCVPEGSNELKDTLPLNMNLHLLHGINFTKGCYIGQELTQRTYHTGVIRKMAMPFICADKLIYTFEETDSI
jgi:folate-binding protein YgfZ